MQTQMHRGAVCAWNVKYNILEAGNGVLEGNAHYLLIPFMRSASTKHIMINGTFANYLLSADEKSATVTLNEYTPLQSLVC